MKKIIFIILSVLLACATIFALYHMTQNSYRETVANKIIHSIGGDKIIKQRCMEENTGDITMENGEIHKRYFTMSDIMRVDKMCDCVVAKAHKTFQDPEIYKKINEMNIHEENKEILLHMLMSGYIVCELELYELFKDKYETIVIE